ncbi:hypothetical protein CAEBREN_17424 [Caenorhabditis brenneri]|uniref:Uncharacterized protein n=1 Tax=Caenorhabditis brenneri TaxID=135651 RepID=G0MMN2_CAEBE|nr:hypothetical protein CAEBREN_17424 [Caenorhabditis brenneri]
MDATSAPPVLIHNGQVYTVEDLQSIIQQRDAQEFMIGQMQENNNQLSAAYRTIWYQNEYHKNEMERLQQENVLREMHGNNTVPMRDYQALWEEKEDFKRKTEQLQEQVQKLEKMKREVKLEPIESNKLRKRVKKEVKEEVEVEPMPLPNNLDFTMYLYNPNGSQELPQIVKKLGWQRKFYQTVTGNLAASFDSLDSASKKTWDQYYTIVKARQNAQVTRGQVKALPDRPAAKKIKKEIVNEEENNIDKK